MFGSALGAALGSHAAIKLAAGTLATALAVGGTVALTSDTECPVIVSGDTHAQLGLSPPPVVVEGQALIEGTVGDLVDIDGEALVDLSLDAPDIEVAETAAADMTVCTDTSDDGGNQGDGTRSAQGNGNVSFGAGLNGAQSTNDGAAGNDGQDGEDGNGLTLDLDLAASDDEATADVSFDTWRAWAAAVTASFGTNFDLDTSLELDATVGLDADAEVADDGLDATLSVLVDAHIG